VLTFHYNNCLVISCTHNHGLTSVVNFRIHNVSWTKLIMFTDTVTKAQVCESNRRQEMLWTKWDYLFQFANNKFSKYLLKYLMWQAAHTCGLPSGPLVIVITVLLLKEWQSVFPIWSYKRTWFHRDWTEYYSHGYCTKLLWKVSSVQHFYRTPSIIASRLSVCKNYPTWSNAKHQ
jgi:hypothetical protein